ncbi:hypothetical protein DXB82_00070 [Phocaeicola vulgatus]|uniref:HTH araC/xylS-type domain-containing protein n=2 Tax=Phocaeicola vulgatus TaxID=821 RepID=A0A396ARK3_PHOVU|nr:putative lipoprotein [Phocaeicola vulgatus str. 3775 SL(B) 10 (iv)]RGJ87326.1 hypothetical protein DXD46_10995 [Phocaeicola vulgatus]HAU00741.1 hypothetical protein [Bacteroides sp.]RGL88192.1 hypothetical protein DXC44_04355 [Phocaeicola vulgatus]RGM47064.1 hypothetical protein DXC16_03030 [Phocaeicola vulgatus]
MISNRLLITFSFILNTGSCNNGCHDTCHEMVGYNDISTFRKHFVDFYGTTPSTFKSKEDTEDKK